MEPGWIPPSPRCLEPMQFHEMNEPRDDRNPVCWRPKGHPPTRHLSFYAYMNELERTRRRRGEYQR